MSSRRAAHHVNIDRDGRFNLEQRGLEGRGLTDLYHLMLSISWPLFLSLLVGFYVLVNLLFACAYTWVGGISNSDGRLLTHFFFAIETMSTVGYGSLAPTQTSTHWLMVAQSIIGFLLTAVSTGLMFAKFSRIEADILFSRPILIQLEDNRPVLTFRAANKRKAQIVDAQLNVTLVRDEVTLEGIATRRLYDLPLRRQRSPLFALVWNVYHEIDSQSPLCGATPESLAESYTTVIITCRGLDDKLGQTLHTRYAYNWQDFVFQHRFVDLVRFKDNGERYIDYAHFHEVTPQEGRLPWWPTNTGSAD